MVSVQDEPALDQGRRSGIGKNVFVGAGLVSAAGIGNKAISFFSALILTRYLGPEPYGQLALLLSIATIGSALALGGVDHAYARFYFSPNREPRSHLVEHFSWRRGTLAALVVSIMAGAVWPLINPPQSSMSHLAPAVTAASFLSVMQSLATTRQRLRGSYGRVAAAALASGASTALLSVGLVLLGYRSVWVLVGGLIIGLALPNIVLGWLPVRDLLGKVQLDANTRKKILQMGWSAAMLAPAYWVTSATDRWFIGHQWGAEAVGIYSFAANIGTLGVMISAGINTAWFPEASRSFETDPADAPRVLGHLWSKLVGLLLVGWAVTSMLGGDLLRSVADQRFHTGAAYIPWIAGGTCFYGIASLAGTGPLLRKNLLPVLIWWVIGALLSLGANALLIPQFGPKAAAWIYCTSHAIIAGGILWWAQLRLPLHIAWMRLAQGGTLVVLLGAWAAPQWAGRAWESFGMKVTVLAGVALLLWTAHKYHGKDSKSV